MANTKERKKKIAKRALNLKFNVKIVPCEYQTEQIKHVFYQSGAFNINFTYVNQPKRATIIKLLRF